MSIDTSLTIRRQADGTIDTAAYIDRAHALRAATLWAWLVARFRRSTGASASPSTAFAPSRATVS